MEIEARKQVVGRSVVRLDSSQLQTNIIQIIRIESQSSEAGVDSRHIVKLEAIVNILPVDRSGVSS